jgi:2-polyprenyl-3-methyl-5-hydroxy-6-metoxy-1,4-benzoquinol methylase
MVDRQTHWNDTYGSKAENQVSWFQVKPERSLELIATAAPDHAAPIIDIGGGASRLADTLLALGYSDVTALDIAETGLARTKTRLGTQADKLSWIVADVTQWQPQRTWQVWHDRAVFHFLTEAEAQDAYIAALKRGTTAGSSVIIATFAPSGPERCSGLPVQRYSAATLAKRLGAEFTLYAESDENHATPFGTTQQFQYAAFRRR